MKLTVIGMPATQGSKRGFPIRRKNGKLGVAIVESSGEKHKTWRSTVVDAYREWANANGGMLDHLINGPVIAVMTFYLPRPKTAPKHRLFPDKKPDALKLGRAVEDSLSRLAYIDDGMIVDILVRKRFAIDRPPGVEITLRPATEADL
jgi:Holliday junction resolvase RusA-like endonuclease